MPTEKFHQSIKRLRGELQLLLQIIQTKRWHISCNTSCLITVGTVLQVRKGKLVDRGQHCVVGIGSLMRMRAWEFKLQMFLESSREVGRLIPLYISWMPSFISFLVFYILNFLAWTISLNMAWWLVVTTAHIIVDFVTVSQCRADGSSKRIRLDAASFLPGKWSSKHLWYVMACCGWHFCLGSST
jgi:hypothetical protein